MKIVTSQQMAEIDRRTRDEFATPDIILMENAGIRALDLWLSAIHGGRLQSGAAVIIAGGGNNGGDALVMARSAWIMGKRDIAVVQAAETLNEKASLHAAICGRLGIPILTRPGAGSGKERAADALIASASVVFDGIAGTGLKGPLREEYRGIVELLGRVEGEIVSIDVPSGVGDGFRDGFPAVKADVTLAIGLPKFCLYLPRARRFCVRILVVPIGFPEPLVRNPLIPGTLLQRGDEAALLPPIAADAYKNIRGHASVFAGRRGTAGAALLCARGAGYAGAGLVSLFVDPDLYSILAGSLSPVMIKPLDSPPAPETVRNSDAACVGPGWGREGRAPLLRKILDLFPKGVIDADALAVLAELDPRPDLGGRWILTPHFERWPSLRVRQGRDPERSGQHPPPRMCKMERFHRAQGRRDLHRWTGREVLGPGRDESGSCDRWIGGCPSGIITALLAGGAEPATAAAGGALIHARAGELATAERGWFLADDLIPFISRVAYHARACGAGSGGRNQMSETSGKGSSTSITTARRGWPWPRSSGSHRRAGGLGSRRTET